MGIIGNTQGVSNAANPDKNAIKNIDHKPFSDVDLGCSTVFSLIGTSLLGVISGAGLTKSVSISFTLGIATGSTSEGRFTLAKAGILKINFFSRLIQTSLHI